MQDTARCSQFEIFYNSETTLIARAQQDVRNVGGVECQLFLKYSH